VRGLGTAEDHSSAAPLPAVIEAPEEVTVMRNKRTFLAVAAVIGTVACALSLLVFISDLTGPIPPRPVIVIKDVGRTVFLAVMASSVWWARKRAPR